MVDGVAMVVDCPDQVLDDDLMEVDDNNQAQMMTDQMVEADSTPVDLEMVEQVMMVDQKLEPTVST